MTQSKKESPDDIDHFYELVGDINPDTAGFKHYLKLDVNLVSNEGNQQKRLY